MSVAPRPLPAAAAAVADARALTQRLSRTLGIPTASALLDRAQPRPVGPALAGLFSRGGLPHGEVVRMSGGAALSLALACCAPTTRDGGWCAGIGLGGTAVAAIADLGVDLDRFVRLDTPAQDWMRVVSILVESFDILLVDPGFSASAGEQARIAAKLRDSRATLILLDAGTPGRAPRAFPGSTEHVTVRSAAWEGTDAGTGRLRRRVLRLHSARTGEHTIVLPDPQGAPAAEAPTGTLRLVHPRTAADGP